MKELPEERIAKEFFLKDLGNYRHAKPSNYGKLQSEIKAAQKKKVLLMLGAGMGAETHLPMGDKARIRLENGMN